MLERVEPRVFDRSIASSVCEGLTDGSSMLECVEPQSLAGGAGKPCDDGSGNSMLECVGLRAGVFFATFHVLFL